LETVVQKSSELYLYTLKLCNVLSTCSSLSEEMGLQPMQVCRKRVPDDDSCEVETSPAEISPRPSSRRSATRMQIADVYGVGRTSTADAVESRNCHLKQHPLTYWQPMNQQIAEILSSLRRVIELISAGQRC